MQLKCYEKTLMQRKLQGKRERRFVTKTSESEKRPKLKSTIMGLPEINIGSHDIFKTKSNFLPKERRSLKTKRTQSRKVFFPEQ